MNEFETETAINETLAAYRASDSVSERANLNAQLFSLRQHLQGILTEGANPCSNCGAQPMGIHQPTFYEIGCGNCKRQDKETKGRSREANYASKGKTVGEAVANWNASVFFLRPDSPVTVQRK